MSKIQIIRSAIESVKNKSGIGYYADYLESQLKESNHSVESVVLDIDSSYGYRNIFNIIKPILKIIKGRGEYDITHFSAEHCSLLIPFSKSKRVVTFHHVVKDDGIETRYDEIETGYWKIIWSLSVLISKIFTDRFIAISPQTKKDMVDLLGIKEDRITVVMHPPNSDMYATGVPKEDIFLFVGTLMGRKNPLTAISVFETIVKIPEYKDFKLVMCGDGHMREETISHIEEKGLTDSIILASNLSVAELRNLYNIGRVLFNTSNFEGLGITILESQLCGTPVLFFEDAEIPPEVTVAAVPCTSEEDMAKKTIELLENDKLMTSTSKKGIIFAKEFGKDYKEKLKEIYST